MRLSDGGYSECQFNRERFLERIADLKIAIPELMARVGASHIVVTGKSGISMAFAAMAHIPFNLVVVRKRGEQTHGNPVEGQPGVPVTGYMILDDFVSSGDTLCNIHEALSDLCNAQDSVLPPCLGVIMHSNNFTDYTIAEQTHAMRDKFDRLYKFGPRYAVEGRASRL